MTTAPTTPETGTVQRLPARYRIDTTLYACTNGTVTFPEGKSWVDVKDWYVKYDTLYVVFRDNTEASMELNSETPGVIDWERPSSVEVYELDEDGEQSDSPIAED
jgi:hypothetical protein